MGKFKDLTGEIKPHYKVISEDRTKGKLKWKCLCECGKYFLADSNEIVHDKRKSCGCLRYPKGKDSLYFKNEEGNVYNNVEIKKYLYTNDNGRSIYTCVCPFCGEDFEGNIDLIKRGSKGSCGCNAHPSGENSWRWNPDREEILRLRNSKEYLTWREAIYIKGDFKCSCCKDTKGGNLNAHHLKSFTRFPELRFDVNNGVILCEECHKEFHSTYGTRNFTSDDYFEFLKEKGANNE